MKENKLNWIETHARTSKALLSPSKSNQESEIINQTAPLRLRKRREGFWVQVSQAMNQHRVLLWVLAWLFIALVWALFDLQFAAVLDSFTSAIVLWRFAGIERNDSDFSEREQEKERRYVNKLFVRITLQ